MALSKALDQVPNLNHLLRIKTHGRFVQNQNLRCADQRLRNTDSLPVTLGEVLNHTLSDIFDLRCPADLLQMLLPGQFALFQAIDELQIFVRRHIRIKRRKLRQVT